MKTLYILKGIPASGKTTWSKKQTAEFPNRYKRINKDDLRAMLDDNHWSKGNEKFVLRIRDLMIKEALRDGKNVISDDTNLAQKHETRMRQLVQEYCKETGEQVRVVVKFFDISVEECIKRDLNRSRSVGEQVIKRMYRMFLAPKPASTLLEQDKTLPRAIICDLDGTLAILNRNPYDASKCEEDILNLHVANTVKTYKKLGHQILLVSGRQDTFKPQTIRWLEKHEIPYDHLIMRGAEDRRKDSDLKEEIFNENIRNKYYIDFVLDDRNQVVYKWRELGLTCFQVAEGDF
jgi:predicted kinase